MKIFCNTTFDATKSLITAQANNNLASFPTLYFEDKLPIEIVFVGEGGELASFVGQAGNLITIAIGNLETRQIITQAVLDSENKAVLDIGTAAFFTEMYGVEQKTFIFEIQICFSTGKTRTLCQQNCLVKNQIIGTEITPPTLERPNPPTEILAGAFPNPPMNVVPEFSPTGIFTIEPVSWTNLSEINLSGEKLINQDFNQTTLHYFANSTLTDPGSGSNPVKIIVLSSVTLGVVTFSTGSILNGIGVGGTNNSLQRMEDPNNPRQYPYTQANSNTGTWDWVQMAERGISWEYAEEQTLPTNWTVLNGNINQTEILKGIIQGNGTAVALKQNFAQNIATGTKLVFKATISGATGNVRFNPIRASDGVVMGTNIGIDPNIGYASYETTTPISGVKIDTLDALRQINSVSVFQGVISGGTVQANPNGGLQKINGVPGFNAGASSTNFIDGNSNGYFQFQWAYQGIRVGLTYQDANFETITPYQIAINHNGSIFINDGFTFPIGYASTGEYFRIRHYQADNTVHFQRKENIYQADSTLRAANYAISNNADLGHYVVFLTTENLGNLNGTDYKLTLLRGYKIVGYSIADNNLKIIDDNGLNTWLNLDSQGTRRRGHEWEFATNIGQDYLTLHTHGSFTNGENLYFDSSLYTIGSQINDVLLAK